MSSATAMPASKAQSFGTIGELVEHLKRMALSGSPDDSVSIEGKRRKTVGLPTMNISVASAGKLRIITSGHADILWATAFQLWQALAAVREVNFVVCVHIAGSSYLLGSQPGYLSLPAGEHGTGVSTAKSIANKKEVNRRPLSDDDRLSTIKTHVKKVITADPTLGDAVAGGSVTVVGSTGASTAFNQYGDPTGLEVSAHDWQMPPRPPSQCDHMFNSCTTDLCASVLVAGSDRVEGAEQLPIPAVIAVEGRSGWGIGTVVRGGVSIERGQIPLSRLEQVDQATWKAIEDFDGKKKKSQANLRVGDLVIDMELPVEIPQFVLQAGGERGDADPSAVLVNALDYLRKNKSLGSWRGVSGEQRSSSLVQAVIQLALLVGVPRGDLVAVVAKLALPPQPEPLVNALGGQMRDRIQNVIDYMNDSNPHTEMGYVSPFLQEDIALVGAILTCGYGQGCDEVGARVLKGLYSTIIPAEVQSKLNSDAKIDVAISRIAQLKNPKGTGSTPKVLTAQARGVMGKAIEMYHRIVSVAGVVGAGALWWFGDEGGAAAAAAAVGSSSASSGEGGGRRKRRTRRSRHARNKPVTHRSSQRLRRVVQTRRVYGRGRARRTRSSRRDRRFRR